MTKVLHFWNRGFFLKKHLFKKPQGTKYLTTREIIQNI
jgi:hypothetical protein